MKRPAAPRRLLASITAVCAILLFPAVALGHPLGNFTINTHNVVRVGDSDAIVDHVLDMAEIPAFQERQEIDTDNDEAVSDAEAGSYAERRCLETTDLLDLQRDGIPLPLELAEVGISFPPGQGGLDTLRLVCVYAAPLDNPIDTETRFTFEDRSHEGRLGWREIVVVGDGMRIGAATVPSQSISARLTSYPEERLTSPMSQTSASFSVLPGGSPLPPFAATDAGPIGEPTVGGATPATDTPDPIEQLVAGMNQVIQIRELTPFFVALSIAIATALGALHAVSPGHGKTVMAAYLVGAQGTARHAIGLGLTVTVSHTLGVLGLAVVTLFASTLLPAERLYPILGLVSGLIIVGIGLYLLVDRLRDRLGAAAHAHSHEGAGEHSHGPLRHSHVPTDDRQLSWRNLFALGLAGGLVPSASALILLLGSVSLGRPA
ncbi:MAG: hypothetical protein M3406_04295, partial [Chloroflexota bacterium]|nr:hypothetical protein [Chloroflexota bacterium]